MVDPNKPMPDPSEYNIEINKLMVENERIMARMMLSDEAMIRLANNYKRITEAALKARIWIQIRRMK